MGRRRNMTVGIQNIYIYIFFLVFKLERTGFCVRKISTSLVCLSRVPNSCRFSDNRTHDDDELTSDRLHSKNVFCNARHSGGQVLSFKHSLGVFLSWNNGGRQKRWYFFIIKKTNNKSTVTILQQSDSNRHIFRSALTPAQGLWSARSPSS